MAFSSREQLGGAPFSSAFVFWSSRILGHGDRRKDLIELNSCFLTDIPSIQDEPNENLKLAIDILQDLKQFDYRCVWATEEAKERLAVRYIIHLLIFPVLTCISLQFVINLAEVVQRLSSWDRQHDMPLRWDPAYHPWFPAV